MAQPRRYTLHRPIHSASTNPVCPLDSRTVLCQQHEVAENGHAGNALPFSWKLLKLIKILWSGHRCSMIVPISASNPVFFHRRRWSWVLRL